VPTIKTILPREFAKRDGIVGSNLKLPKKKGGGAYIRERPRGRKSVNIGKAPKMNQSVKEKTVSFEKVLGIVPQKR